MGKTKLVVMARVKAPDVVALGFCEPETYGQGIEDEHDCPVELPIESLRKSAEPGQDVFGQPDVVFHVVLITANFVRLLDEVGSSA